MIASRGHRLAQRFLNEHGSIRGAARNVTATTSSQIVRIDQRHLHTTPQNGASSSYMGTFRPSLPKLAKKRSSSKLKAVLDEAEDILDEEDEGTAFDEGSDYIETTSTAPASKEINSTPRESFEVVRARCLQKLNSIQEGSDTNMMLSKSDWIDLLASATTSNDLQDMLDFRKQWYKLSSSQFPAIQSLSARQGRGFLSKCQQLRCADLMLEILNSKATYGFDFSLEDHRRVQGSLLSKLIFLKSKRAKGYLDEIIKSSAGDSIEQIQEESLQLDEEKNLENENIEARLEKAKLSVVDQMMALSAVTKIFSIDLAAPDHYCVLITIRGIIEAFYLNSNSAAEKEKIALEKDILPRISRALMRLSNIVIDSQIGVSEISLEGSAISSCAKVVKYLVKNQKILYEYNPELNLGAILTKLGEILKQCNERNTASIQREIINAQASIDNHNM